MNHLYSSVLSVVGASIAQGVLCAVFATPLQAQIIPNRSLSPDDSRLTPIGPIETLIEGGATRGKNLFHSFEQFNVGTGEVVLFADPGGIDRIFSKVTGGIPSRIDGEFGVLDLVSGELSDTDLFLLNPSGVILGPNGLSLVLGSLVLTSAEQVQFENGDRFSAASTDLPAPLLNIGLPVGLQMGAAPGVIVQESPNFGGGLQVAPEKTLALLGGDIELSGPAFLNLAQGRLVLGALGAEEVVNLQPDGPSYGFDYRQVETFADIQLLGTFIEDPFAVENLEASFQGKTIVFDGAEFGTIIAGDQPGAGLIFRASEQIVLTGAENSSFVFTDVFPGATGSGGDLFFEAPDILIEAASELGGVTAGIGNSGKITLRANNSIVIRQGDPATARPTVLFSEVLPGATGNGGDLLLETPSLTVEDLSDISSITSGEGNSSTITIRGWNPLGVEPESFREVSANQVILRDGLISSITQGSGNSGDLSIQAKQLFLEDGSEFLTLVTPETLGNAGNVSIQANEIQIQRSNVGSATFGVGKTGNLSISTEQLSLQDAARLVTLAEPESIGATGNVVVQAKEIKVQESQIGAGTFGVGNAGRVDLSAETVELSGTLSALETSFPSGIFSTADLGAAGNGNSIVVEAKRIALLAGATVQSRTAGSGNAGEILLNASDEILVQGRDLATGNPSAITNGSGLLPSFNPPPESTAVLPVGLQFGDGGAIEINTPRLRLEQGGLLTSTSFNNGQGGPIRLAIDHLEVLSGAQVQSSSFGTGEAGTIEIDAAERILVSGQDPNFAALESLSMNVADRPESDRSALLARSFGDGGAKRIVLRTPELSVQEQGVLSVSSEGQGAAGNLEISANQVLLNEGFLEANTQAGSEGNITLGDANLLLLRNGSAITTNAGSDSTGGNIDIQADVILALPSENSDITANALRGPGGQIQIQTQGLFGLAFRDRLTPASDITASSQAGVDGAVEIALLGVDPNQGLVELPTALLNPDEQISTDCRRTVGSRFIVSGRGGLPTDPRQQLLGLKPLEDWRQVEQAGSTSLIPTERIPIVPTERIPIEKSPDVTVTPVSESFKSSHLPIEAEGWYINANNDVQLVSQATSLGSINPESQHLCSRYVSR